MTQFIRTANATATATDPDIDDAVMVYISAGELRRFAAQQQSDGAQKLRASLAYKARKEPISLQTMRETLIDARIELRPSVKPLNDIPTLSAYAMRMVKGIESK